MIHLDGVAYLPDPADDSANWKLPDGPIPLRVEFDPARTIGSARLTREEDGSIMCRAYVANGADLPPDVPKFAVGVVHPFKGQPELFAVSAVKDNTNPAIPPYSIGSE